MNYDDLKKLATPGPLIVTSNCCGYSGLAMTEMGESAFGACGDKGLATVQIAAHCYNHFDEVVEALEKTNEQLRVTRAIIHSLRGYTKEVDRCDERQDANVALIARAKEVKA